MTKIKKIFKIFLIIFVAFIISRCEVMAEEVESDTETEKLVLTELSFTNAVMKPILKESRFEYELYIDQNEVSTEVNFQSNGKYAFISGIKDVILKQNKYHYITMITEMGEITLYRFKVLPEPSSAIFDISFDEVDYDFEDTTYEYNLEVPFDVRSIQETVSLKDGLTYEINTHTLYIGDNKIVVTITYQNGRKVEYIYHIQRITDYPGGVYSYTGDYQTYTVPYDGDYQVELWGSGGSVGWSGAYQAKGAYTSGTINLTKGTILYLYVGGRSREFNSNRIRSSSNGGATDIRYFESTPTAEELEWDSVLGRYNRIMVAAGAGGSWPDKTGGQGGNAGGLNGYSAGSCAQSSFCGGGATQTSAGSNGYNGVIGGFGYAGRSTSHISGGNGYYGGGGGHSGGGGSSFISGHTGCNAINASGKATGQANHYSGMIFSNTVMVDGLGYAWTTSKGSITGMPSPTNTTKINGNSNEGYARISYLGDLTENVINSIILNDGAISFDFDPHTYEYTIDLTADQREINIQAIPNDIDAVLGGVGKHEIAVDGETITVSSTSMGGKTTEYVLHFRRTASTNAKLSAIKINGVPIDDFDPEKTEYEITLPYNLDWLKVEAVKGFSEQVVTGEIDEEFLGEEKEVNILVVSEDPGTNKLYELHLVREKTNKLRKVIFAQPSIPFDFSPDVFEYDVDILDVVLSIDLTYSKYFEETTVTAKNNLYIDKTPDDIIVTSHLDGFDDVTYTFHLHRTSDIADPEKKFEYTGEYQEFIVPYSGYYQIQLWGAGSDAGWNGTHTPMGAYTSGKIKLNKDQKLYFYVGGNSKGFNLNSTKVYRGGGATDVRLEVGAWNNTTSLRSRIMVAAGAGGSWFDTTGGKGGSGGGLTGYSATNCTRSNYCGGGATQTSAGSNGNNGISGGFGISGYSTTHLNGGNGYYGGGAGHSGGGGSSFISGHLGCNAINENGGATGQANHYSGFVFTETKMIDGNGYSWTNARGGLELMPSKNGDYNNSGIGNKGDGAASITLLETLSSNNYLDSITLNDGNVSIPFEPWILDYDLNLPVEVKKLKIEAVPKDEKATIVGLETIDVAPGDSTHVITVTASDGSIRTYTLNLNRPYDPSPYLENVSVDGLFAYLCNEDQKFCQYKFESETLDYHIIVPFNQKSFKFTVTPISKWQTYEISVYDSEEKKFVPSETDTFDLLPGENLYRITVTSEDGHNEAVYEYTIDRDITGNNNLKSLAVENPTIPIENFDPYIYEYYLTITSVYDRYDIIAVPESNKATVSIKGNESLKLGMNDAIITVTAENGNVKTYIIHMYYQHDSNVFLSSLTIKDEKNKNLVTTPVFSKLLNNYTLTVSNEVNALQIEAIPESEASDVEIKNPALKSGLNEVTITVKADSGDTNVYTINVYREKDSNAKLSNLEVEGYPFEEEFSPNRVEYNIAIPREVTKVQVSATPELESSTYKIQGAAKLTLFNQDIKVTVTAEDGTTKVYTIHVMKDLSADNDLTDIILNDGDIPLNFDGSTEYYVNVDNEVTQVNVKGILSDSYATLTGNGTYSIAPGTNKVVLTVKSEQGEDKEYTVIIERAKNADVALKEVKNNRGSEVTTSEGLTAEYDYLMNVQYEIPDIIIEGIPNTTTSKVAGNGYYSLNIGNNDITLRVTSEAGNYKDYVVRVVRDLSTNDDLSFLYVEEGGLNPHFNETTIYYNVKIPYEKDSVHIEAIPEDKDATVEIIGDTTGLEVGVPREIQVVVTAPKGNQKTYTLSITRQEATTENLALFKLETNRGELTPVFNPDTLNYELTVENDITDITVTAEALSDNVTVIGTGKYNLNVGKNGIAVFVVGEDEVQRDYQIVVTRKKSKDATLSALVVKSHVLSPTFNKNTENYTLTTSGTYLDFTTIKPTESEATYKVTGNENFTTGENTVTIEVTAPDGETKKTYTLTVTKSGSKNNNLASLEVEGYQIIPNFHKVITFYSLEVPNDLNSVVITATTEDPNATITGDGLQKIETGENYFEVVVTSESGTEKKYTILINKEASDNNYLGNLFLSEGELTPEFDKETTSYGVTVPYTVSEITLTGDPEDSHATVTGLTTYQLQDGLNTIVITVTSESGLVRTYTVKVTKEETVSAYLTSLEATGYELDTPFNKELFEYYITVGNEVTELDLNYTTEDKNATVVITGNENFEIGMNEIHIEVTASDGETKEEYILYVNREFSTNNYLSSLSVDKGTLDPEFDPKTLTYNVEVEREVDKITVSATTEDKSAAIISGTGEHNLNLGNNVIQVKVKSSIGITRTYKINVLRKQSSNNYLSILVVSNKGEALTLTPSFNKLTNEYNVTIGNDLNFVQIRAEAESEFATVIGNGTKEVKTGSNRYEITVTAEDGSINTYILNITKEVSDNNYLSSLVPSVGTLDPVFNKETLEYTLELGVEDTTLGFTAVPESNLAKVTGDTEQTVSDGESIRLITVTAENGDIRTYKIKVKKETDSEPRLERLEILGYPFEFDPDTFEYTLQVSKSKKKLLESEITAVPKDPEATVNLMGDLDLIADVTNTYIVEVIAKDGYTTQQYKIHITRDSLEYTIRSDVYDIGRDCEVEYVIGMDPKTKKSDFIPNFLNDSETLHVYGSDGVEITDSDQFIGSYMIIKLEIDGYTYDELVITIRGDLNGDGLVTAADNVQAKNCVLGKKQVDFLITKIADINGDGLVTAPDVVRIKNYILGKRGLNEK